MLQKINKKGQFNMREKGFISFLIIGFLLVILLCAVFYVQSYIDKSFKYQKEERLLYLPTGRFLKPLCLGYEAVIADMLWLKAVGYFGGHYLTDKSYKWLYHILDIITTLDPQFTYPYEFGGIILALEEGNYEQSTTLLEKGITYYPDYWRLNFYLGFNYFYFHKDLKKASYYMTRAAQLPGHPKYLPKLAASLLTQAGKKDQALYFLNQLLINTDNEWLKEKIRQKIDELKEGKLPDSLKGLFKD